MTYRSYSDLHEDVIKWIQQLPSNIELVVGIPRSGLLVANLISLHLNIPMADLDGFLAGRILSSGERLKIIDVDTYLKSPRKVLVVDDSVCSGKQIEEARCKIIKAHIQHNISYAAIYIATYEQRHTVDYYYQHLPLPRIFEWNIFHHSILEHACVDIDGVLSNDPEESENDDGPNYEQFLHTVKPIRIPSVQIGWLVTCRLEKYRAITEEWLEENSIRYNHLMMMNYPDRKTRQKAAQYSAFKAQIYKTTGAQLFIESSKLQAEEIALLTGKYVYCTSTHTLINPSLLGQLTEKIKEEIHKTYTYPWLRLRSFLKFLRWWILRK